MTIYQRADPCPVGIGSEDGLSVCPALGLFLLTLVRELESGRQLSWSLDRLLVVLIEPESR